MAFLTLQYLEYRPGLSEISSQDVRRKLAKAASLLPISHVLVGWRLPRVLLDTCREETARIGAKFYRWHPLLAGDGEFVPRLAWQTISASQEPIPGFRCLPEFTFVCANHPYARSAVLRRLDQILEEGHYQGLFLDRIRFPSPAVDPMRQMGCFCPYCQAEADRHGLDLQAVRREIIRLSDTSTGRMELVRTLFQPGNSLLDAFITFRSGMITELLQEISSRVRSAGMEVGLDCFAPSLMRMVGQDLAALGQVVDWIKVMIYAHTLGPAGMPYELLALHDWLTCQDVASNEALALLSESCRIPLPERRELLENPGLSAQALRAEINRARNMTAAPLLAGIELVDLPGVTHVEPEQLREDLAAISKEYPAGLALSWDLWEMPEAWLEAVGESLQTVE